MLPIHPGVILEQAISARGLDPEHFHEQARMPRKLLQLVLAGERPISWGLALRLGRVFGTSPWVWLAFQERFNKAL
ncbi:MAG TPA: HigA family addiction module antitoxin [Ferrovibrio sp.]|uniref:HigA family addiction module antitoxin n=1 Tax=Ferrovibrio sp. TaxID=1917215 RepID=UPI002B4B524D|nr:HigA family addiction module antitoxin [Ferrovibrio sp.]HLT78056.1 HigA family addiction module antitoxin [Ferrovibrio sp.]